MHDPRKVAPHTCLQCEPGKEAARALRHRRIAAADEQRRTSERPGTCIIARAVRLLAPSPLCDRNTCQRGGERSREHGCTCRPAKPGLLGPAHHLLQPACQRYATYICQRRPQWPPQHGQGPSKLTKGVVPSELSWCESGGNEPSGWWWCVCGVGGAV